MKREMRKGCELCCISLPGAQEPQSFTVPLQLAFCCAGQPATDAAKDDVDFAGQALHGDGGTERDDGNHQRILDEILAAFIRQQGLDFNRELQHLIVQIHKFFPVRLNWLQPVAEILPSHTATGWPFGKDI